MEKSLQPTSQEERGNILLGLAKNQEVIMSNQEEFKGELRHLRDVVIGNGDSSSMLNQIKQLEFGQVIAKSDRERMERHMDSLNKCVGRMERDEIATKGNRKVSDTDQKKILKRLDGIEATQKAQGELIQAFRNRVIGIIAVVSFISAGAGFLAAARFLETAVLIP